MKNVQILGTGSYVPSNIVTNDMLSQYVETSDEWIVSRTGIKTRYISKDETTTELAINAAKLALQDSNTTAEEIELIIVATITQDTLTPSTACNVQAAIGAKNAMAFDISSACSGFIYGIDIASQFIKNGTYKKALVIGAEVLSKIIDWNDRSTCVLFGDGAGAAVIAIGDEVGITSVQCKADGSKGESLTCSAVDLKNIYNAGTKDFHDKVVMNGKDIFKFAVAVLEKSIERILVENNLNIDDIDYIVPHQANFRIIEAVSKRKNYDINKFYMNLSKYGNTSSASIILALDELNKKNLLKKGSKIIIIGFGGGLTYGSALINWNKVSK
ncbi:MULTISPECIES: beta-ketoacyl-ACP synthase III [unclassified Clostridium]|uniref:beta-ketoacyl-ACP synthase III n=1 Tax=unclassified Clostridium TaxID=2614128 RepID=UPI0025BF757C|nr:MULTISPECIES: beta-ketoacyl-ACP synthase III [unclassified Clostridium]